MEMPEGTHLAYVIYHETKWWGQMCRHDRPNEGRRCVQVYASAKGAGGGTAWEFSVIGYDFDRTEKPLRICMFDDAWMAFAQVPEFFAALTDDTVKRLDDIRALLDQLGAVDETERS